MQHDWMQWILCSMAQSIPIECSGFHAASLNAEDSMHFGAMDPDCMQWSPCSEAQCIPIECSGLYAAWPKTSRLNAVDSMQHDGMKCIPYSVKLWNIIVGSGFYAAWLSAVDSMKHDWMQWILCSMAQIIPIEYSVFHEASMNARIPCFVAHWILIVCNGVHAARPKASRLNAVDFMRHGPKHPDWMQWIPCIVIECSELHAAW